MGRVTVVGLFDSVEGPYCALVFIVLHLNSLSLELFFFGLSAFSRATPKAYGGFQARGPIGAIAVGLCQSHSNAGSEPHLQSTPQLVAMPDP